MAKTQNIEAAANDAASTTTGRYNLRARPAKVEKPVPKPKKRRLGRLKNGMMSLLHTPEELIPTVQANSTQSPLLNLPAEIRNKIFKYSVSVDRISISANMFWERTIRCLSTSKIYDGGEEPVPWRQKFALTRACRQIYSETATLVYSENTFTFVNAKKLAIFKDALKQAQLEAMRTIRINPEFLQWHRESAFKYMGWHEISRTEKGILIALDHVQVLDL